MSHEVRVIIWFVVTLVAGIAAGLGLANQHTWGTGIAALAIAVGAMGAGIIQTRRLVRSLSTD
jgi:hypothetical protein